MPLQRQLTSKQQREAGRTREAWKGPAAGGSERAVRRMQAGGEGNRRKKDEIEVLKAESESEPYAQAHSREEVKMLKLDAGCCGSARRRSLARPRAFLD